MRVFADTSFYLALVSPRGSMHSRALALTGTPGYQMTTTDYVLVELANALCGLHVRNTANSLVNRILAAPHTRVLEASREFFHAGLALFAARPDKNWSLTDCISFEVMQREKLERTLSPDHHFRQAGFVPLLVPD